MEANGRSLVDFWNFTAERGLMNANTAGGLKGACKEVLSAVAGEDGWEEVDLKAIDVDDYAQRFERLRMAKFKPNSLAVYKSRFKNAVQMFLEYLDNPSGWRYTADRPAKDRKKAKPEPSSSTGVGKAPGGFTPPPDDEMITYPFPLRHGLVVTLRLPEDMTAREADRLCTYVKSLAFEAMKELPAVSSAGNVSRAS